MSQLDRTHDHSPAFDQSLQAVLGLAWLLSHVDARNAVAETAGSPGELRPRSSSSGCDDPASLAVLGVVSLACELSPILDALRAGAPPRVTMEERARLNPRELDGLLR
jgi:hypothetical protein